MSTLSENAQGGFFLCSKMCPWRKEFIPILWMDIFEKNKTPPPWDNSPYRLSKDVAPTAEGGCATLVLAVSVGNNGAILVNCLYIWF